MLIVQCQRSVVPVTLLTDLKNQPHPDTEVEVDVTVEDEVARIVQLGPEDHIAGSGDLDHIFGKAVVRVGVIQFPFLLLMEYVGPVDAIAILPSTHYPVPASVLMYRVGNIVFYIVIY